MLFLKVKIKKWAFKDKCDNIQLLSLPNNIFYRSLHTGPESGADAAAEQVAYQPGIDYSLQRRDAYPHMPQHIHGI